MKTFRDYLAGAKLTESVSINKAKTQKAAVELLKAAKELASFEKQLIKKHDMELLPDDIGALSTILEAAQYLVEVTHDDDFWEEVNS